jgi:hypothetical protein
MSAKGVLMRKIGGVSEHSLPCNYMRLSKISEAIAMK